MYIKWIKIIPRLEWVCSKEYNVPRVEKIISKWTRMFHLEPERLQLKTPESSRKWIKMFSKCTKMFQNELKCPECKRESCQTVKWTGMSPKVHWTVVKCCASGVECPPSWWRTSLKVVKFGLKAARKLLMSANISWWKKITELDYKIWSH